MRGSFAALALLMLAGCASPDQDEGALTTVAPIPATLHEHAVSWNGSFGYAVCAPDPANPTGGCQGVLVGTIVDTWEETVEEPLVALDLEFSWSPATPAMTGMQVYLYCAAENETTGEAQPCFERVVVKGQSPLALSLRDLDVTAGARLSIFYEPTWFRDTIGLYGEVRDGTTVQLEGSLTTVATEVGRVSHGAGSAIPVEA
jgi:hypothetical protein